MCEGKKDCNCSCKGEKAGYTLVNDVSLYGNRRVTDEGYLVVKAILARTGIQEYRGKELLNVPGLEPNEIYKVYRPASEVFNAESMRSFESKPVSNNHPPVLLNLDNIKAHQVGYVSDKVVREGNNKLATELFITDKDAIEAINNGKKELSNGYTSDHEVKAGVTKDGEHYDIIQRNIRGNHVAIVEKGRCGAECSILDTKQEENKMANEATENVTMIMMDDGITVGVADSAVPVVRDFKKQLDAMKEKLKAKDKELSEMKDKFKASEDEAASEKEKKDEDFKKKKAEDEKEKEKEVNDKIAVIDTAKSLIDNYDWAGKSVSDIKRDVISAKHSGVVLDAKSAVYIDARYDIIKENLSAEPSKRLGEAVADAHAGAQSGMSQREKMIERNNNYNPSGA